MPMPTNKFIESDKHGRFVKDHYIYKAVVSNLAVNASATSQINIDADSDFIWVKSSYFADIAGAGQTDSTRVIPLVRVSVTDSGSGRNLQNLPIPVASFAGHEGLPLNIVVPRVFVANSNISVTFTNFDTANTYGNVELSFIGYKKLYL